MTGAMILDPTLRFDLLGIACALVLNAAVNTVMLKSLVKRVDRLCELVIRCDERSLSQRPIRR